jgi:predicted alpha/beta superfamily hydrolase
MCVYYYYLAFCCICMFGYSLAQVFVLFIILSYLREFVYSSLSSGSRFEDLLKRLSHIFAVLNVFIENEKEKN